MWERVKRLEREGLILGYRAVIAPSILGTDIDFIISLELRSAAPIGFRRFEAELKSASGVLGATRTGPGAYQLRAASRTTLTWIEAVIAKCGLTTLEFRTAPALEEIVPYRDPPIRVRVSAGVVSAPEDS